MCDTFRLSCAVGVFCQAYNGVHMSCLRAALSNMPDLLQPLQAVTFTRSTATTGIYLLDSAEGQSMAVQGSIFSAVLGELLDAVRWPQTPTSGSPAGSPKPSRNPSHSQAYGSSPAAVSAQRSGIATAALAAHPYRPLYLSGGTCQQCQW